MLLAQINRDSQGMAEFQDADGQPVTLCLTEAVTGAGTQMETVDTVSLQAVTLSDGSTAYIQHEAKAFSEADVLEGCSPCNPSLLLSDVLEAVLPVTSSLLLSDVLRLFSL
uniref:Zinc finger protein 143 n=1 Tax=Neogobius melanostomus TaxID=47308 RepID=A0A8C6T6U9_9GOBI